MTPAELAKSHRVIDDLSENSRFTKDCIPSGVRFIDEITCGGWVKGTLTLLAGRPGMGKTAFALQFSLCATESKGDVFFLSLEMSGLELLHRIISSTTGINLSELFSEMRDADLEHLVSGIDDLHRFDRMKIASAPNSIEALEEYLTENKYDVVFVDYLQLMRTEAMAGGRYAGISDISARLKRLAVEQNIAVVSLCQLNRENEKRPGREPAISDLRDSGSLEQDADMIILLNSREYYEAAVSSDSRFVTCNVAKNRSGKTGLSNHLFKLGTQQIVWGCA